MSDPLDLDPIRARTELREKLVAAQLASVAFRASDGYMSIGVRDNIEAADAALEVVEPLLAEVDRLRDVIGRAKEEAAAYEDRGFTFSTRHLASSVRVILSEVD